MRMKIFLIWFFSACVACGAVEFYAGKYNVRDFDIFAELENLSVAGCLSGGIVRQIEDKTGVKSPPLYRGAVSDFEILPDKEAPGIRLKLLPGKVPPEWNYRSHSGNTLSLISKVKKSRKTHLKKRTPKPFFRKGLRRKAFERSKLGKFCVSGHLLRTPQI